MKPQILAHTVTTVDREHLYYWVKVSCSNCKYVDSVAIYKGNTVESVGCPKCECSTLGITN